MKNNDTITLDKAKSGIGYYIKNIYNLDNKQIYRFYDFGIVKNSKITPLFSSVIKGARAYYIKGCLLALRNEDAKKIIVSNRR